MTTQLNLFPRSMAVVLRDFPGCGWCYAYSQAPPSFDPVRDRSRLILGTSE